MASKGLQFLLLLFSSIKRADDRSNFSETNKQEVIEVGVINLILHVPLPVGSPCVRWT